MGKHMHVQGGTSDEDLSLRVEVVSNNPVVTGVLRATGGVLAVLDEERRILSVNDALLRWLGLGTADRLLGLRPGDALNCIHAHDAPGGCGTSTACESCGAAIAIATSLSKEEPMERTCALTSARDGVSRDLYLRVHSCPLRINSHRLLLLFLQDITQEQHAMATQRIFFHDVANLVMALSALTGSMSPGTRSERLDLLTSLVRRLEMEVQLQRALVDPAQCVYQAAPEAVNVGQMLEELAGILRVHPCSSNRRLELAPPAPGLRIITDGALLSRVLANMLINAFEATPEGGEVRMWAEVDGKSATFCVRNAGVLAPEVSERIFQRNFSTKASLGRGLGTYAMKLFGERILKGKVSFSSASAEGTTFRLTIPMQ